MSIRATMNSVRSPGAWLVTKLRLYVYAEPRWHTHQSMGIYLFAKTPLLVFWHLSFVALLVRPIVGEDHRRSARVTRYLRAGQAFLVAGSSLVGDVGAAEVRRRVIIAIIVLVSTAPISRAAISRSPMSRTPVSGRSVVYVIVAAVVEGCIGRAVEGFLVDRLDWRRGYVRVHRRAVEVIVLVDVRWGWVVVVVRCLQLVKQVADLVDQLVVGGDVQVHPRLHHLVAVLVFADLQREQRVHVDQAQVQAVAATQRVAIRIDGWIWSVRADGVAGATRW